MKSRPILFSGAMVRALLDGSKMQTRRVVKPQPVMYEPGQCVAVSDMTNDALVCPHGKPGDRLWVRENFAPNAGDEMAFARWALDSCGPKPEIHFAADGGDPHISRWRPSIHMPRWVSRILLEIVSVRVERLNDISEVDAIAEGAVNLRCQEWDREHFPVWRYQFDEAIANGCKPPIGPSPAQAYEALWESINGAGSWAVNPWVWVVEFKRVQP